MKRIFKSGLSIFLAITIIFSSAYVGLNEVDFSGLFEVKAVAASFDDFTYKYSDDGVLTISGKGDLPNYTYYSASPFKGSTEIKKVVITEGITSIGDRFFYECTNLSSITIPDSVTTIGTYAFDGCTSLKYFTIPDSVTNMGTNPFYNTAYYNDKSNWEDVGFYIGDFLLDVDQSILGAYEIKEGTKTICQYAFSYCTSLNEIKIPDSVTTIGVGAFSRCDYLFSVYINNLSAWCNIDFGDFYSNPLYRADNLYINNELTTDIVIPEGVISIPEYAFSWYNLMSIIIPDSVTSIGDFAFENCNSLENVYFQGSSTEWDDIAISTENQCLTNSRIHYNVDIIDWKNHYGEPVVDLPTCIENGSRIYTCPCGYEIIEELPELGHSYSDEWILETQATCTTDGSKYKECVNCGDKFYETLPSLGHSYVDSICSVCGCEQLPESLHPYENSCDESWTIYREGAKNIVITFSEDTETESGYDYIYIYDGDDNQIGKYCGIELAGQTVFVNGDTARIRITSNDDVQEYGFKVTAVQCNVDCMHNWVIDYKNCVSATCSQIGVNAEICSICNESRITEIPTTSHSFSIEWTIDVPATCTASGLKYHKCTGCGNKTDITVIEATGHSYSNWLVEKVANCTEDGCKYRECVICGDKYIETLPAIGHVYGSWRNEKAATCTENGLKYKECLNCGEKITESVSAIGHVYGSWRNEKAATCTENGLKYKECLNCGEEITEAIPSTSHISSSWLTDKKATVYSAGNKHKECTECGEVLETATIAQLKCSKPTLKSIENTEYGVLTKWGKVKGADKYYIYRKVKGGSYSRIGSTTNTYYTDKTAKSGKKYYYIVKAINEAGASSSSSALSKLYLSDPTLKTPTSSSKGIALKWTQVDGAQGYMVYRKEAGGSYKRIKTEKGETNLSYRDTTAKKGTKYYYKVKAYYSKTYSAYSNTKTITDKY